MQAWALDRLQLAIDAPQILGSDKDACCVVALLLPVGDTLQEHQVHEGAVVFLTRGLLLISAEVGERTVSSPSLICFEPGERHHLRAVIECQLVLCYPR
jgi:quercetin dioxygenase-like cupin family protein